MASAIPYAAAALPAVIGLTQKRPKMPSFQYTGPDRSAYIDRLLESSFNPQSELYRLAADQVSENVNRTLANRGLMDSSLGMQQIRASGADLANKFLEGELERRRSALGTAQSFDSLRAGIDQQRYGSEMDRYKSAMDEKNNMVRGIADLIGTEYGIWNNNRMSNQIQDLTNTYRDALASYSGVPKMAPFVPAPMVSPSASMPWSVLNQGPQQLPYNLGR